MTQTLFHFDIQHKEKEKFQKNGSLKWDSSWILFSEF